MKRLILLLLVLMPFIASAQPVKSSGLIYYDSIPNTKPSMPYGSEVAYSRALGKFYRFNLVADDWEEMKGGTTSTTDSTSFVVYKESHGYNLASYPGEVIAIKADYTVAYASTVGNTQVGYVVGTPHPDSIELQFSGLLHRPAHGLTPGKEYFLQDIPSGLSDTIPGTVVSRTFIVVDSNYLFLSEVGTAQDYDIPIVNIPAVYITGYGGDPAAPHDTVIQKIAELFAEVGLIKPGSYLVTNNTTISDNPIYQTPSGSPTTPSAAWVWPGNGEFVTRMKELVTDVDLQDTLYGGLGTSILTPLMPAGAEPTTTEVASWYQTNFENNGLQLANGAKVYWVGNGTQSDPDLIWEIQDDLSHEGVTKWERIVKKIKKPENGVTSVNGDTGPAVELDLYRPHPDSIGITGSSSAVLDRDANYSIDLNSGDNLITNPTFADTTGWGSPTGWDIGGGSALQTNTWGDANLEQYFGDSVILFRVEIDVYVSGSYTVGATGTSAFPGNEDYADLLQGDTTLILNNVLYDGRGNLQIFAYPNNSSLDTIIISRIEAFAVNEVYNTGREGGEKIELRTDPPSNLSFFSKTSPGKINKVIISGDNDNSFVETLSSGSWQFKKLWDANNADINGYYSSFGLNNSWFNATSSGSTSTSSFTVSHNTGLYFDIYASNFSDFSSRIRFAPSYTEFWQYNIIPSVGFIHRLWGNYNDILGDSDFRYVASMTKFHNSNSLSAATNTNSAYLFTEVDHENLVYNTTNRVHFNSVDAFQSIEVGSSNTNPYRSIRFEANNQLGDTLNHLTMLMPTTLIDHTLRPYDKYALPNLVPTQSSGAKSVIEYTGTGSATTPAFLETRRGTANITGDGDGEQTVAVTFASAMPDATYNIQLTVELSTGTPDVIETIARVASGKTTGGFTISLGDEIETGEELLIHWTVIDQ